MKLQREVVVQAALELLNQVGIDGLTTRRLAEKLGVQSPALYWHFKSKRALLDQMAEAMLEKRSDVPIPKPGTDWHRWFAESARSFRQILLRYRDGARLHAGTPPSIKDLPSLEEKTQVLCNAGFSPAEALRALATMSHYTVGFVLEEQAALADATERTGPWFPDVSVSDYRLLSAGFKVLRKADADTDFEYGLQMLLAGLDAKLHKTHATRKDTRRRNGR
jgi:TetR/AcrR family transcriptional regulator, tetracycline repressor protein